MSVITATSPAVEIAGKMRLRYTCTRCGRKWDGTPPTFEEERVCVVTLVFCSEGSPAGFDTAQYTTATDNDAAEPLYNRLVEFEKGATNVVPGLATKWDISEDGLTYTFHLREGVKFHSNKEFKPTRDFNADDVLFTFNRMLDPDHPFRKAYPTEFPYFNGMSLNKNIAKVEKTGPHTVVMTLNTVDAAFIQNIAMSFASILSAEYADHLLKTGKPSDINKQPRLA